MNKTLKKKLSLNQISSNKRGLKDDFSRVTFIVKEQTAYKLNCIASYEDVFLKEIVNGALEKYIQEWEKRHGDIGKTKRK